KLSYDSMESFEKTLRKIRQIEKITHTNTIHTIPDIMLYVDEKQIQTVFSNIILNAIDATKKGKISIIAKETEDGIQIEFIDSGPGISKDKINNIFEPLYTTKQSGTGLGLSSAKRIIESHGGIIEVQNNPTKFTITLPKNNS
ncbi:Sensor protein ZraS, partial [Marine Group I thaumarchaeote SCGC AAA799-N04]